MTKPLSQKIGSAIFISDFNNVERMFSGSVARTQIRGSISLNNSVFVPADIDYAKIKMKPN